MKYDMLHRFREYLEGEYGRNTADKYYFAVKGLLDGLDCGEPSQLPADEIQRRMSNLKTRNDFNAAKRGLMELQVCFPDAQIPDESFLTNRSKRKRNYKKRTFEPLALDTVTRKVNAIRNRKLKLAYRIMLASGARVSEVAALVPEDISIEDGLIRISIENGKGGKRRTIDGIEDEYLKNELQEHIASTDPGANLFYSAPYMKERAGELGIECHDLRRAFSKTYLAKQRRIEPDAYTANGNLMAAMGHASWRTTKRYLRRKIKISKG